MKNQGAAAVKSDALSSFSCRLVPLYFSAQVLWVLIGFSCLGVLLTFLRLYLDLDVLEGFHSALSLD